MGIAGSTHPTHDRSAQPALRLNAKTAEIICMKPRARDLGITLGQLQPGPFNAITDVPGVRVGHTTLQGQAPNGKSINSGVTLIEPRAGSAREQPCFAGVHVLNGNGDATGLEWVREAGLLHGAPPPPRRRR